MENVQQIHDLVKQLNKCSYEYYTLSNPSISDKEYDILYASLEALQEKSNYIPEDSPTQRIGDIVLDKFEKHEHKFRLYSMDKAQNMDELDDWHNKNKLFVKQNNLHEIQYVVEKKFDGLTINNTYKGVLLSSATRGTGGIKGELVTAQVKTIKSIPLRIDSDILLEVHGEAYMKKSVFNKYNETAKVPLKNVRNGAAGAIKNLDAKETANKSLDAFFYDIGYSEGIKFNTYMEMMEFITKMGLPVDQDYYLCNTIEEVKDKIALIEELRQNLDYEIDGVIVSINDIKTRGMMGFATKWPKWAISFKYESEETTTELLDIEFRTGRTGKVTPRGTLEPVDLMGSTVSYATLNSMDDIKKKGVKIGATIFIRKSNDVIPEILGVVEDSITEDMPDIKMPTHCQSCGSELVQDGVHYFCRNSLNCKAQIVKSIAHFGTLQAMNIDKFSEKTAELFYENGIINSVLDLFKLEEKRDEIIKLPKFGVKKYNNLIQSIENCKKVKLDAFVYALGIEGIGLGGSKNLCKHFNNEIIQIMTASVRDLLQVDDFGPTTADNVYNYFMDDSNYLQAVDILCLLDIDKEEKKEKGGSATMDLIDKTFVVTGEFTNFKPRKKLEELIESLGGKLTGSVSKSTFALLTNDTTSGTKKNQDANKHSVQIMDEETFMKMVGI